MSARIVGLVAALASHAAQGNEAPAPPPIASIELVCLAHLDIGFTASPQEVARREKEHIDHAIALCEERADFRWTIESIWQLEQWLARTSDPRERARLARLVKDGRIEIAGGFANFHTGVMDAELLLRSFEPAERIRRELGVPITACVQDDVPGFSWLLPTAMAENGIRFFLAGVNTSFGGGTTLAPGHDPFWWEGRDGSRVLTWVANDSYVGAEAWGLGVWQREEEADAKVKAKLAELAQSGYAFPRMLVMAAVGDNGDPDGARAIVRHVDAWNAHHAAPQVRFTTPSAFLSDLAALDARPDATTRFPVARGEWAGHWEVVKASAPAAMALYRDAEASLLAAEAFSLRAHFELGRPYPQHDLDEAVHQLLIYSEHSSPGGVGWPKLLRKEAVDAWDLWSYAQAHAADETLRGLIDRALDAYADAIASDAPSLIVANPSAFERDDEVVHGDIRFTVRQLPPLSIRRIQRDEIARQEPSTSTSRSLEVGDLAALRTLALGGDLLFVDPQRERPLPIDATRDAFWTATLDLKELVARADLGDPVRLFLPIEPSLGDGPVTLRFTTPAGVIGPEDFLPGALPRNFCTSGAIELGSPTQICTVALREPFSFQFGRPGWLGTPDLANARELWIELLQHAVRGETKDRGVVDFARTEPAPDDRREFHLAVTLTPSPRTGSSRFNTSEPGGEENLLLVHAAAIARQPLIVRDYEPWIPHPARALANAPLVTVSAPNVVVLACRLATPLDGPQAGSEDVIVRVQEIAGAAPPDEVAVTLALPGFTQPRTCKLGAYGIATLRFVRG